MELPVDTLIKSRLPASEWSKTGWTLDDWNEAYCRVEAYFSSLRVENKLLLSSFVIKILNRARQSLEQHPGQTPVELSAIETDRLLAEWFRKMLGEPDAEPEDRLSARGRLALFLVEKDYPWQELFLADDDPAPHFVDAMQKAYLRADPDFRFVEMRPRPIDLGIVDIASRAIENMGRWRTVLFWAAWVAFGAGLTLLFIFTR